MLGSFDQIAAVEYYFRERHYFLKVRIMYFLWKVPWNSRKCFAKIEYLCGRETRKFQFR